MSFEHQLPLPYLADNGAMTKLEKRGRYQYGGGQIPKKYSSMQEIFQ
jgi:hypothetical protein